ncbi:helix-turn-helix domain-containing protein [Nocardia suismassiliense]|uniref:Helix-turn-helix domain-containing protein n=1 Tax=Nocardia suismassiliense TaxID=2077092 RepID=A0ABW6QS56_9NOCA
MGQKPGGRGRDSNRGGPVDVCVPELPATLRQIRDQKNLSRATAYKCSGVAPSYIYQIESGLRQPSLTKLDCLINAYELDEDQARYVRDLRSPPVDLEPEEELRRRVTSDAGFSAHLQDMQNRGMPGAYMTPLFNVLMCNDLLRSVLPGIDEAGSILVWQFSPVAKELQVYWEREAVRAVATAKGVLARHRHAEHAQRLLRKMSCNNDFRRIWESNIDVSYGRDSTDLKYFRVRGSDEIVGYSLTLSAVPETSDLVLLNVVRKQSERRPGSLAE